MRQAEHEEWHANQKARKASSKNHRAHLKAGGNHAKPASALAADEKKKDDGENEMDRNWVLW